MARGWTFWMRICILPRYDSVLTPTKRVITVAPMPPEKSAYALARYSRSPDSIRDSIEWVRTHDSMKFLESFYFQYGHASIADLGHTVMCFEGISEIAATEIEEEPLWDGQAKSSRYQDFSKSGFVTPPEFEAEEAETYQGAGQALLTAYAQVFRLAFDCLAERLPRPDDMKADAYQRNIAARAFDVARYLLFWGVPTNVGQVTSIRTLEKQIRRLRASEYGELRSLGEEIAQACAAEPDCRWELNGVTEPLAPGRDPGRVSRGAVRVRHGDRYWGVPRSAPASALPEIPAGIRGSAGVRFSDADRGRRGDGGLQFGDGGGVRGDAPAAAAGGALSAAVRGAVAIPVQDGFCGGRVYLAAAERGEGAFQLSADCVGDEVQDGGVGAGIGAVDRRHTAVGGGPVEEMKGPTPPA